MSLQKNALVSFGAVDASRNSLASSAQAGIVEDHAGSSPEDEARESRKIQEELKATDHTPLGESLFLRGSVEQGRSSRWSEMAYAGSIPMRENRQIKKNHRATDRVIESAIRRISGHVDALCTFGNRFTALRKYLFVSLLRDKS